MAPILSKAGDQVFVEPTPAGVFIRVIPKRPPLEPNILDIFSAGLRFTSAAGLLAAINTCQPFSTKDELFRVAVVDHEVHLDFGFNHAPSTRFVAVLSEASTDRLKSSLGALLMGDESDRSVSDRSRGAFKNVGRNDPCPCGSGKKHKKCCLGARPRTKLPPELEFVKDVKDPIATDLVNYASARPDLLGEGDFWDDLGVALGSADLHEQAKEAFERSLSIDRTDEGALMNLAATLTALGRADEAFNLLLSIKNHPLRFFAIQGNTLQSLARHEEAVESYERAIIGEPAFDLPYVRIQTSLAAIGSPLREYWFQKAIEAVPDSPAIAVSYGRYLFLEGRLDELEKAEWIDELASRAGSLEMIGRRAGEPRQIIEAQLWRACGRALKTGTLHWLEEGMRLLRGHQVVASYCDPAKALVLIAANAGRPELVEEAADRICDSCKVSGQWHIERDVALGFAYSRTGRWGEACELFHRALEEGPLDARALQGYWWALDELDRIAEAIEIAKRLRSFPSGYPSVEFNLGYLCNRAGLLGEAKSHFEHQLEQVPDCAPALENIALLEILEGDFDKARTVWKRWMAVGHETEDLLALGARDEKNCTFEALIAFAESRTGGASYSLEVKEFNDRLVPKLGTEARINDRTYTLEEVLRVLADPAAPHRLEVERQYRLRLKGDHSALVARLKHSLAGWQRLPEESKLALIEGERRLSEGGPHDYAPEVVSLAKAVEITLKVLLFESYKSHLRLDPDVELHFQEAVSERFRQAHTFLRFLEKGQHLEFGAMVHVLRLAGGTTAKRLHIVGGLQQYINERQDLRSVLTSVFLAQCDELVALRNSAAHAASYGADGGARARALALSILASILALPSDKGEAGCDDTRPHRGGSDEGG